jgi:hypothetical protein
LPRRLECITQPQDERVALQSEVILSVIASKVASGTVTR